MHTLHLRRLEHHLQQTGLTMLELLITLGIAAILASLALPSFASMLRKTSTTVIANQLIGLVQYARAEAVAREVTVTLCGSSNGQRCDGQWSSAILVFSDHNEDGVINNSDTILRNIHLANAGDQLVWRVFGNKPYLQLHPTGITYFQNGNFTYCPKDNNTLYALHWIMNVNGHLRLGQDTNHNGVLEKSDGTDISCPP